MIEGSLEVKLPTIWTDEKQSRAEAERRERLEERRVEEKESKMQMREKVGKSRNTVFFQWFVAPEGRKRRLATAAGAEPAGQMRDEKVHAVVARSTFRSQNAQNTWSDHFWKLRCRKSARRCGAKHISKSKCTKHLSLGPFLEVAMSKKCTPLWRDFQVKMYKTHHVQTTFGRWDVEKVHAVVARSTFPSQNVQSTRGSDHFWRSDVASRGRRKGLCTLSKVSKTWGFCSILTTTTTTPHYTPIHYATLHLQLQLHLHYILHTTLHYTTLHSITLNYTTLRYTTLRYTTLHYTTLNYTTLPSTTLH